LIVIMVLSSNPVRHGGRVGSGFPYPYPSAPFRRQKRRRNGLSAYGKK
jgi:hypothetical protein